ncbi:hypothetical protein DFS34DRAFT_114692 [Phlyctochytrium arcticum]|nr:hypothetical protein DFS34DRAFT_114692 [Phlyctochytrium arcticum]
MLGLAAVPAIIQFPDMATLPKSPRFLVQQGKSREAMEVLALVRPRSTTCKQLEEEVENIKASLQHVVEQVPDRALISNPDYWKAMTIAIGLQVLQQFSGINTVIYYSVTILRKAAFPSKSSASSSRQNRARQLLRFPYIHETHRQVGTA